MAWLTAGLALLLLVLLVDRRRLRARRTEADRILRATADTMISVIDAVTEQAVVGTDLDGTIRVWNPGAEAMLGLPRADVVRRRSVLDVVDTATSFAEFVTAARQQVRDWTWVTAGGDRLTVALAVTPRLDAAGRPAGWTFVATDMTEARELARLKDEFVGVVSHELRTPLASVVGYLDLVLRDPQPPSVEHRSFLEVARRNADRLVRLVGDLLLTAQVDAGQFTLTPGLVDLGELARAARDTALPAASAAGVELLLDLPTDALVVPGDALRLGQAADNLVGNAVKFTARGGRVTLAVGRDDDGARLTVTDTGIGVPTAELGELGTRFYRASTARSAAVPGLGLGLSITAAIAAAHGGRLTVDSTEGRGTAVALVLPARVATPEPV